MPCACKTCVHHAATLGLGQKLLTQAVIRKAFRSEAKRWHPDRFENEPTKRREAEEHFKLIQVAYRELWEHCEHPAVSASEVAEPDQAPEAEPAHVHTPAENAFAAAHRAEEEQLLFFGGAPNCFVAPHFPRVAGSIVLECTMEATERPLAIVDLSGRGARPMEFSQYILLTSYRVFVRNVMRLVGFLWYSDLGSIRFVDLYRQGKHPLWVKFVDKVLDLDPKYSLEIYRRNGTLFHSIGGEADDSVKKVIYNFLLQKKSETPS
jgi:DnaJ domain